MTMITHHIQVHRFGDTVACYVGIEGTGAATVYLKPVDARKLAKALNSTAREINSGLKFANSKIGTFESIK